MEELLIVKRATLFSKPSMFGIHDGLAGLASFVVAGFFATAFASVGSAAFSLSALSLSSFSFSSFSFNKAKSSLLSL